MSTAQDPLNFFILEASECIERLDGSLHGAGSSGGLAPDDFVRAARTLRGAATMHRLGGVADLSAAVERAGRALRAGEIHWSTSLHAALVATVDDLKILLHKVRTWGPAEDARTARRITDLSRYIPASAGLASVGGVPLPPPGETAGASADAYFAAEAGEIAAALEVFVGNPSSRQTLASALARVRTLRGVAALADRPPLPETLDAIERAGRVIEVEPSRDMAPVLSLLASAAALLKRAAAELSVGGTRSVLGTAEYHRFVLARALAEEESEAADRIVPVDELFYADASHGEPGLASEAPNPPTTPAERFRLEVVSQAEHLRALIAAARDAGARQAGGRESGTASDRAGAELRAALRALANAARSFKEERVVDFVTPFASGQAPFDFLALSSLDDAAALLANPAGSVDALGKIGAMRAPEGLDAAIGIGLGRIDQPPPAVAGAGPTLEQSLGWAAERRARATTPTGRELQAFLQDGIVGISHLMDDEPLIASEPESHANGTEVVPIDSLLYRGQAALDRARTLRDSFRTGGPTPESLAELFDLLDLASTS